MVDQVRSLCTDKPFTIILFGRRITIYSYEEICRWLRIRDKYLDKRGPRLREARRIRWRAKYGSKKIKINPDVHEIL